MRKNVKIYEDGGLQLEFVLCPFNKWQYLSYENNLVIILSKTTATLSSKIASYLNLQNLSFACGFTLNFMIKQN